MKYSKIVSGIKFYLLVFLNCLFLQLAFVNGQTNIEQDPGKPQNNLQNAARLNQNLRQIERLQIPDNLIRIQKVIVPPLIGQRFNLDEISALLDEVGLQLGQVVPVANNQQAGFIVNQYPPEGREVNYQTQINLAYAIESIQGTVTVPRYVGLTIERAVARMPNDRLTEGEITEVNSERPPGIVVAQFPEEGSNVDAQTKVNLNVSNGRIVEPKTRVPDVVRRPLEEAAAILREAGLFAGEIIGRPTQNEPGIIIDQTPGAGTLVDLNSTVNIVFSELIPEDFVPEEFVIVPNVTGMPKNEAILVLKENNLNYAQQFVRNSGLSEGMVSRQDVSPGKEVPVGTTVVIQIQEKRVVPPWVYWGVGILAAGFAGGLTGRKISGRKKRKMAGEKKVKLDLKPVWDVGKQSITKNENNLIQNKIHLKYISDNGTQTLK